MTTQTPTLTCIVAGASGRMGRQVLAQMAGQPALHLAAAWVGEGSAVLGQPAPGFEPMRFVRLGEVDAGPAQVVIDFSRADAFDAVLAWCRAHRVALVSGTTGLDERQRQAMAVAAGDIPVLWSANFSLGMAVLEQAVALAARALPGWHAEIFEAHHAGKRDAPSGSALALGRSLAAARGQDLDEQAVFDRHGAAQARPAEAIGFSVIRAGDIVGEHAVWLATAGERLELAHRAGDRGIFARGALHAARWLHDRPAGRYRFADSLAMPAD